MRVANELGMHYQTLRYHLNKKNLKLSELTHQGIYILDESVFNQITEQSAYWIGFLMADGCVYIIPEKSIHRVVVNLQSQDLTHLEKFQKFLKTDRPIYKYKKGSLVQITIASKKICESVMKYGVVPRKCKTTRVIELENNRHFWRGVVDGDGSIYKNQRSSHISLNGSKPLMKQFSKFVKHNFPDYTASVRYNNGCFTVCVGIKMIGLLYSDCTIALDRKLERAEDYISRSRILNSPARRKGLGLS